MSKCWYCNEEITTGNNPEHLGICNKCYDEMFKCGNEFISKSTSKIAYLKAKLAEKEEELKYYETLLKRQCNECKEQDKISFCIERLEKVRHYAQHIQGGLIDYIDKQIKQLKGEV